MISKRLEKKLKSFFILSYDEAKQIIFNNCYADYDYFLCDIKNRSLKGVDKFTTTTKREIIEKVIKLL